MGDRFNPEELRQLIESGELTADDISILHPADAKVAQSFLNRSQEQKYLEGALPMLAGGISAAGMGKAMMGLAGKVSMPHVPSFLKDAAGSALPLIGWETARAVGDKFGVPWWLSGPVGAALGGRGRHMGGSSGAPKAPSEPKPWGQRSAPVAGSKQYGPAQAPKDYQKAPNRSSEPPNLKREGNLTRPGPDGPGSPSRPSWKVENPLDQPSWKGPMGNEDNWRTLGKPEKSVGADLKERRQGPSKRPEGVSERRYEELRKLFGGNPGARRSPTADNFDEADKRKVLFGGVGATTEGGYKDPHSRKPLTKAEIKEIIDQIMRLR